MDIIDNNIEENNKITIIERRLDVLETQIVLK